MYYSHSSRKEALNQPLLHVPKKNNAPITRSSKDYDSSNPSLPLFRFLIRNPCKDIIHTGTNAEEYYHVELVCDEENDTEYGIQAYGDEAKELYKEINGFTVHTDTTPSRHMCKEQLLENDYEHQEPHQEAEAEKLKLVKEAINFIADSCFDSGCVLMFKKLGNVCVYKRKI
jgi:hypothetical protein